MCGEAEANLITMLMAFNKLKNKNVLPYLVWTSWSDLMLRVNILFILTFNHFGSCFHVEHLKRGIIPSKHRAIKRRKCRMVNEEQKETQLSPIVGEWAGIQA